MFKHLLKGYKTFNLIHDSLPLQVGMLDLALNRQTKALFLAQVVLSVVMVALQGFLGPWFRNLFCFVVLFSYIIPIRYVCIIITQITLMWKYCSKIISSVKWEEKTYLSTTFIYVCVCSLRVNLDMGKSAYSWMIMKDEHIPGTVVRTSTILEELGRLVYLLTDKTGTFFFFFCCSLSCFISSLFLCVETTLPIQKLYNNYWFVSWS